MNLVENIDHYTSSCGYCSSGDSAAMGMWAHKLSCEAYQDLLDRGWRRSGQWVYRPLPDKQASCQCHPYTIRLDTGSFKPSKDQRKVLRRFEAFLEGRRSRPVAAQHQVQGAGECRGQLSGAQPEAAALGAAAGRASEQQWLLDDRKRKSHLISPSPLASPAEPQSLAEEAADSADESPACCAGMARPDSGSPMGAAAEEEAEWASAGSPMTLEGCRASLNRQGLVMPCGACEAGHECSACPQHTSGSCTPSGSDESASSAVAAAAAVDPPALLWPEHSLGYSPPERIAARQGAEQGQAMTGPVEAAMQRAVHELIMAGRLPSMQVPTLAVKPPTRKQQSMGAGDVVLTSSAAHAIAAAARRAGGSFMMRAEEVAETVASQMAAKEAVLRDAEGCRLTASADAGHLNFLREQACVRECHTVAAQLPARSLAYEGGGHARSWADDAKLAGKTSKGCTFASPESSPPLHSSAQGIRQRWSIPARYGAVQEQGLSHTASPEQSADGSPASSASACRPPGSSRFQSKAPQEQPRSARSDVSARSLPAERSSMGQHAARIGQGRAAAVGNGKWAGAGPGSCASAMQKRLEIRTLPTDDGLVAVEFPLYRKYQILHHGEDPAEVTETAFRRFLIDTPLVPSASPRGVRFGSFHQQYWVDGELIAVGVVDALPRCLSSTYLFWDPDLPWLALGKLTALKEIAWVQAASARCPSLQWYHMGYYLETCPKMRYKADFQPSELLCMRTYAWVPLSAALPRLKADSHCTIGLIEGDSRLAPEAKEGEGVMSAANVLIYCGGDEGQRQLLKLGQLQDKLDGVAQDLTVHLRAKLQAWQRLGGPTTSTCIVLV